MIRFADFEDYKAWMQKTSPVQKTYSNCFLMRDAIRELISEQRLFGSDFPNGRALFSAEDGFYRIYYYLDPAVSSKLPALDKPIVAELVFGRELLPAQSEQVKSLEMMGFQLGRESRRMILSAADCPLPEKSKDVICADARHVSDCKELFREYFNPLYAFVPDDREWAKAIESKTVFCVYENNHLAGALFSQCNKSSAELRLLCVKEGYRGRGYAKKLLSFYHAVWLNQVRQFAHWVDSSNVGAIALYKRFGYRFDNRQSREYILQKRR